MMTTKYSSRTPRRSKQEVTLPLPEAGAAFDNEPLDLVLRYLAKYEPRRIRQSISFNSKTGDFIVTLWSGYLGPREGVAVGQLDLAVYAEVVAARQRLNDAIVAANPDRPRTHTGGEDVLWPRVLRIAYAKITGSWSFGPGK